MNSLRTQSYSENQISRIVLESAYQRCLAYELEKQSLIIETEKALPLVYEDIHLEIGYRVDIFINRKVIIELKAAEALTDVHLAQTLTYLKLSSCKLGLLINFNVALLKRGFKRVS